MQVDLGEVYAGVALGSRLYRLRSIVCYYGQHYTAFVWADDLGAWLMFDDAAVSRVGGWAEVRRKCEAGRIQPSVLFYEALLRGRPEGHETPMSGSMWRGQGGVSAPLLHQLGEVVP